MNRRHFLSGMAGILASGFAPAVVGSGVLMPVKTIVNPFKTIVNPFDERILELLYPPDNATFGWSILDGLDIQTKQRALNLYYRGLLEPRNYPTPKFVKPT